MRTIINPCLMSEAGERAGKCCPYSEAHAPYLGGVQQVTPTGLGIHVSGRMCAVEDVNWRRAPNLRGPESLKVTSGFNQRSGRRF